MRPKALTLKHTLAALVVLVLGLPLVHLVDTAPAAGADPPPARTSASHRITLITGDVVEYTDSGGIHRSVAITAAPRPSGASVVFQTVGGADSLYVIPSDAQPYLASGVLDRALFNVEGLIQQRLDDASAGSIPLLLRLSGKPDRAAITTRTKALPGIERVTPIATRGLAGVRVKRDHASEFWASAFTHATRITLDRTMRVALEDSVPLVGAPTAWAAGLDGRGITVAVVDTGVDAAHPDLDDRIAGSANFTFEPDGDYHGHGTHVASIIAGTGGTRRGVAPGAKLVIAKVFDAGGFAPESQIMAGMEWAVTQGAKVINMSLGGAPTDGTDEISALVNDLTERTGALFVISSGNLGSDRAVTSPGSATSALTVGAVDKQNQLTGFSSRGPRLGDAAVKPEIVAPGAAIAAARAANTAMGNPVDDLYTEASGTSMAAPHVTGAAAILAQQHPDWSPRTLKDALVSTAKHGGKAWFEEGAGRLDVARAVTQRARATGVLSAGRLIDTGSAVTVPVTYTNDGDTPLSLRLSLSVRGWNQLVPPDGTVGLSGDSVIVPAHGTANVTVSINPGRAERGVYGGLLTASSEDGAVQLRTPVSWYVPAPLGPITVNMLNSRGQPVTDWFAAVLSETAGVGNDPLGPDPLQFVNLGARIEVPQGKYTVSSSTLEATLQTQRWTAVVATEVAVAASTANVTLDARNAAPIEVKTTAPTEQRDRTVAVRRHLPRSTLFVEWQFVIGAESNWQVFASPTPAARLGTVSLQDYWTLGERQLRMHARGGPWLNPRYDKSSIGSVLAGERSLVAAWAGAGDFTGIDVQGKLALVAIPDPGPVANPVIVVNQAARAVAARAAAAGAAGLVTYVDAPGALPLEGVTNTPLPQLSLSYAEADALRRSLQTGPVTIDLIGLKAPRFMYNLSYHDDNGIPANHLRWVDLSRLVQVQTRYHADRTDIRYAKQWSAFPPVPGSLSQRTTTWTGPAEWTEYLGPVDERVPWQRRTRQTAVDSRGRTVGQLAMLTENVFKTAGAKLPGEKWFGAPLRNGAVTLRPDHPVFNPSTTSSGWQRACGFCRGGQDPDLFVPAMEWMDTGAGHFVTIWQNGRQYFATTTARLYRYPTGEEVPAYSSDPFQTYPSFRMPAEPGRYRLHTVDAFPAAQIGGPSTALFQMAPRTETTWIFTSRRPPAGAPAGYSCAAPCAFQPLVQLNYQISTDLNNRAPAGRDFAFTLYAADRPDADGTSPTAGLTVEYSTDEGATWRRTTVAKQAPGQYRVIVNHPPLAGTSGFVWLKASAWDTAGNRVDQTIQRAYGLVG